jgi:DNA processing protein
MLDAWLALLDAATRAPRGWLDVLKQAGSAQVVLGLPSRELAAAGIERAAIRRLRDPDAEHLERWRAWLTAPQRELVPFGAPQYPQLLTPLPGAPLALWVEGASTELLNAPQLAIVGSRHPTRGGMETAQAFAKHLSQRGLTITSGLASGIDGASHRGALEGCGGTIAVLGCGPDVVFPPAHAKLTREISAHGLLVSEYPPGTPPRAFHFPQRNRIIAGLTLGTLVVEATRRSGSLITARLAGDYGRDVFAIPGSIHNPLARGCHQLLRQGATLVEEAADILTELAPSLRLAAASSSNPRAATETTEASDLSTLFEQPAYRELLAALGYDPVDLAVLSDRCRLTTGELSSMLLLLELEGFVEALPGGRYSRVVMRSR